MSFCSPSTRRRVGHGATVSAGGARGGLGRHVRNRRASQGVGRPGQEGPGASPARSATAGGPPGPGAAPRALRRVRRPGRSGAVPPSCRPDAKGRCPILLRSVRGKPDGAPGKIRRALRPLAQRWPSDRPARPGHGRPFRAPARGSRAEVARGPGAQTEAATGTRSSPSPPPVWARFVVSPGPWRPARNGSPTRALGEASGHYQT
jgi:hypothetical protein